MGAAAATRIVASLFLLFGVLTVPTTTKKPSLLDDTMALIAKYDTPKLHIYDDNGKPAIGFGYNITTDDIKAGKVGSLKIVPDPKAQFGIKIDGPVTHKAIQDLFRKKTQEALAAAQNALPGVTSHNVLKGVASFMYNAGPNVLDDARNRKLRDAIDSQNPAEIANTLLLFNKRNEHGRLVIDAGLIRRREEEAGVIATPDDESGLQEVMPIVNEAMDVGRMGAGAVQQAQQPATAPPIEARPTPLEQPGSPVQDVVRGGTNPIRQVR